MFDIKSPPFMSELYTSGAYLRFLAETISSYKIGTNTSIVTGYRDISGITSGTYYSPQPSSVQLNASVSANSTNIECDINPLFLNSGYKLILSDSFGDTKMFFANMDHANKSFGTITGTSNTNPYYIFNGSISDSASNKMHTFKFYSSSNIVYCSFMNQYRYIIFAKLIPIDPNDGDKYIIISNSQTGNMNNAGELLFIDNTVASANNCRYSANYSKAYAFNYNISGSEKIRLYNYVYDYKWYSEDIFNIYDISFDAPTIINGELFFPIGGGLYLLVRG